MKEFRDSTVVVPKGIRVKSDAPFMPVLPVLSPGGPCGPVSPVSPVPLPPPPPPPEPVAPFPPVTYDIILLNKYVLSGLPGIGREGGVPPSQ